MAVSLIIAVLAGAAALTAAQTNLCLGEFSTCTNGACALVTEQCGQCPAGQYACPLSNTACSPDGSFNSCPGLEKTHFDESMDVESRLDYLMSQGLTVDEMIAQMTDNATSVPRLSIPSYVWLNDDQHGVKQPDATAFPNGNNLGASWDPALLMQVGLAIGTEARGVHNSLLDKSGETGGSGWPGHLRNGAGLTMYAPNINLVHDPRWGRAQEVMSECPALTGALVAAYVNGLQNSSSKNAGEGPLLAAACCKHFAIYNVETIPSDRTQFNAVVGARDLWETYLPAFESCITEGNSQSVMCSYNSINGVPTCASNGLLTQVLRSHLNFTGFVVSDYDAWANIMETHHYVPTYSLAASVGLLAGLDQEGGGGPTYPPVQVGIPQALAANNITMADISTAVRRLMRIRIRLGMFNDPTTLAYNAITHAAVASPANLALAEAAAREGMTLLKNNVPAGSATAPSLPLNMQSLSGKTVAVLGPNANGTYILLGSYSDSACCTAGIPSMLQEFTARAAQDNVGVSYAPGCFNASCLTTDGFGAAAAAAAAADAVVLVLGTGQSQFGCGGDSDKTACESEGHDKLTCSLPGGQPGLIAAVRAAVRPGVPLIGVLVHGGAYCLQPTVLDALDALLDAWFPGMRGGAAIADALIGAYSPAGRSPVTWYASDAALPADRGEMSPYSNASTASPGLTYRFYDETVGAGAAPVFTFGEGQSYTTFTASSPVAPSTVSPCDFIPVSVTVQNTGGMDSDVVVQVYLAQPGVSVPAPTTRLVTFARVHIAAGQSVSVTFPPITPASRAVVHEQGGDPTDVFSLQGKRWGEQGAMNFRVVTGQHDGSRQGGLAFTVSQTTSQDLATC